MSGSPTLAALATIPSRAQFLRPVLESLRTQVDRLHVYLNGHDHVPKVVEELADEHVLDGQNRGAEKKFHWTDRWDGIYLTCDDDFRYVGQPAYVETMVAAVERFDGRAIVTAHGRVYQGNPKNVHAHAPGTRGIIHHPVKQSCFVNHGGTGVMAFDTRVVRPPATFPEQNMADMQLAVWAQLERVAMWLVKHKARWLDSLATLDPNGLFRRSQAENHERRNRVLRAHGAKHGWTLYTL